jgi:hypothetical protein
VTTVSDAHKGGLLDLDDLLSERGRFRPGRVYGTTNLCNILLPRAARTVSRRPVCDARAPNCHSVHAEADSASLAPASSIRLDACGLSLLHDKQNMRERRRQTYWSCQALGLGLELRVVAAGCEELRG